MRHIPFLSDNSVPYSFKTFIAQAKETMFPDPFISNMQWAVNSTNDLKFKVIDITECHLIFTVAYHVELDGNTVYPKDHSSIETFTFSSPYNWASIWTIAHKSAVFSNLHVEVNTKAIIPIE